MAISFFGDFDTSETVVIPFNTFDSNDPSASVTATTLAATDVHIHKDGGLTQRSSAAGVAVDIDVDTIVGCHWVTIDLSDNTDAGFYADGSQYSVRVEGVTVDAATINPWIGAFSIGRMLRPTTAGRTLDVSAGGNAGIDWANVENPTTALDLSGTDIQLADTVTTVTTTTTNTDMVAAAPSAATIADAVWDEAVAGHVSAGTFGKTDADILADTNELQGDWVNAGRLDAILDAILAMLDDARGEPAQGAPPVNPDAMTKIDWMYKAWRNKKDNDGSTTNLYADDTTTVDAKQTTSESGGTVTKTEWVTGP